MRVTIDIPWQRYALIAELAKRLQDVSPQFGKTALQKIVYFLQEIYGLDCGYDFRLYSYGPFAAQLLGDLDIVESIGCVEVRRLLTGTGGYVIRPTEKVDALQKRAGDFLSAPQTAKALHAVVDRFGRLSARDLELRATIVYVERDLLRKGKPATRTEICSPRRRSLKRSPS